jgi:hypothetical protein
MYDAVVWVAVSATMTGDHDDVGACTQRRSEAVAAVGVSQLDRGLCLPCGPFDCDVMETDVIEVGYYSQRSLAVVGTVVGVVRQNAQCWCECDGGALDEWPAVGKLQPCKGKSADGAVGYEEKLGKLAGRCGCGESRSEVGR